MCICLFCLFVLMRNLLLTLKKDEYIYTFFFNIYMLKKMFIFKLLDSAHGYYEAPLWFKVAHLKYVFLFLYHTLTNHPLSNEIYSRSVSGPHLFIK